MPPNRRRGLGPRGRNIFGPGPDATQPPATNSGGRRPLGPGGAAQQPPPPPAGPTEPASGIQPFSRYERAMFGQFMPTRPDINSSPPGTREELDEAIARASERLSPAKAEALRRAFSGDDSLLLTVRPTNTSNIARPRTLAAGWDADSKTLFVRFRGRARAGYGEFADGVGYEYYNVNRSEWRTFRDNWSPGRYINSGLKNKRYSVASW